MKKIIALVLVMVMCFSLGIGGTLAYLTDRETETNVFTVGNVEIELTEDFEQGVKLMPGVTIDKTSTIKNVGDENAYVFYAYGVPTALAEKLNVTFNNTAWAEKANYKFTNGDYTYTVIALNSALTANAESAIEFTFTLDTTIDIDPEGKWYSVTPSSVVELNWTNANGNPMVYVNAYAIQAKDFADVDAALAAYVGQWGDLIVEQKEVALVATADELAAALANGESVALMDDVIVTSTINIPNDAAATLNLNGHKLSYEVANSGASAIIKVSPEADLEIVGEGTISFVATNPDENSIPSYATNTITNEGTLVIGEGVVVTNESEGGASYAVDNKGKFTLNGGTLIGNRCALRIAKYNQDDVEFVMNGGTVKAGAPAWIQLPGSDAAVAPKITVTINDGTFVTTKASSNANDIFYSYSFGNSHANTTVTINGGYFLGGTVSFGTGYYADEPTVVINGGNFEYDVLMWEADDYSRAIYGRGAIASVSTATELADALNGEATTILVSAGKYAFPADKIVAGDTLICEEGTVFEGTSSLNIDGATVVGATFKKVETTGDTGAVGGTINGVFKDCSFVGNHALRWCYTNVGDTVVFENCVFDPTVRGIHFDVMNGNVIFRNCTISGFNAVSGKGILTFENCTFTSGRTGYNGLNLYVDTVLTDCTFDYESDKTNFIDYEAADKTLTITNCVATEDGAPADIIDFIGGSQISSTKITVDGVVVEK